MLRDAHECIQLSYQSWQIFPSGSNDSTQLPLGSVSFVVVVAAAAAVVVVVVVVLASL